MAREPETKWVVPENLTEEQIADARRALEDLVKQLARISARACHELGIRFDMDDPEVAREVMKMTLEAVLYSKPQGRTKRSKRQVANR